MIPTSASRPASRKRGSTRGASTRGTSTRDTSRQCVVALIESRAREVGVAVYSLRSFHIELRQFGDNSLYTSTLRVLSIYEPVELLLSDSSRRGNLDLAIERAVAFETKRTYLPRKVFNETSGAILQRELSTETVRNEGEDRYLAHSALAALVQYLEDSYRISLLRGSVRLQYQDNSNILLLDYQTIEALELVTNALGRKSETLFGLMNRCKLPSGARMLRRNLLEPPADLGTSQTRLDLVQTFLASDERFFRLEAFLNDCPDVESAISQLTQHCFLHKKPRLELVRNVVALKETLEALPTLIEILSEIGEQSVVNPMLESLRVPQLKAVREAIAQVIDEEASINRNAEQMRLHGAFAVKSGRNGLLDVARKTLSETIEDIHALVVRVRDEQQVLSAQIRFNVRRGYHVMCRSHDLRNPDNVDGICRVVREGNRVLFSTSHLQELNERYTESLNEIWLMSHRELVDLLREVYAPPTILALHRLCDCLAFLDFIVSLAALVTLNAGYTRPDLRERGAIAIKAGRHPVLASLNPGFVGNDLFLSFASNFHVVQGINMAGKTTLLKQAGLLAIMSHVGSYVPATNAVFPVLRRICSILDDNDSIERTVSSFAREMSELAAILRNVESDGRSLVLIDELGRSTSPGDGFSVCWATAEHLSSREDTFTLLATHFAALRKLELLCPSVATYHLVGRLAQPDGSAPASASGQHQNLAAASSPAPELVCDYKLARGPCTLSNYGIRTAAATSMPHRVLDRAVDLRQRLRERFFGDVAVSVTDRQAHHRSHHLLVGQLQLLRDAALAPSRMRERLRDLQSRVSSARTGDSQGAVEESGARDDR